MQIATYRGYDAPLRLASALRMLLTPFGRKQIPGPEPDYLQRLFGKPSLKLPGKDIHHPVI